VRPDIEAPRLARTASPLSLPYSTECVYTREGGSGLVLLDAEYHVRMKNTETRWWIVAAWVVLAAVMVGLLLGGVFGPPDVVLFSED
jgi:hypothetical protein